MFKENKGLLGAILGCALLGASLLALLLFLGSMGGDGIRPSPTVDPGSLPILPQETITSEEKTVKLYFRFQDKPFLAAQERTITLSPNQRLEEAVILELIAGPSGTSELTSLLFPKTKLLRLEEQGATLVVTLSNEFLSYSKSRPDGWGESVTQVNAFYLQRRLSVLSIVNTLTELGDYAKVLLLIDTDQSGVGERLTGGALGFTQDAIQSNRPIEPLAFEEGVVLNPPNTVRHLLQCVRERDVSSLYSLLSYRSENGALCPLADSIRDTLESLDLLIEDFTILGYDVSKDGKTAVVRLDLIYRDRGGEVHYKESQPLKLRMQNEVWKLDYDRLLQLFVR